MSADEKRWRGYCYDCGRHSEIQTRYSHAAKVLCDDCASRPHRPPTAPDALDDLAAEIVASNKPRLKVLDVASMLSTEPPPVPWLAEPLLVRSAVTMLSGREGLGKSLVGYRLACAIGAGDSVASMDTRRGRVLYVDGENGAAEIHRRIRQLGGVDADHLHIVEAEGFHLERDLGELRELIVRTRPMAIVLDSWRSLWPGGDENDSGQVEKCLGPIRALAREHDAGVLLLHHAGKAGQDYRGTTAIGAAIELGFVLRRADGDPEGRTRRELACWKMRLGPEPAPLWLSLTAEDGRVSIEEADPYDSSPANRVGEVRTLLLEALDPDPKSARALSRDLSEPEATVRRALAEMLTTNDAVKVRDGWVRHPRHSSALTHLTHPRLGEAA